MTKTTGSGQPDVKGLTGMWRLVAFDLEDQASGERGARFGTKPNGRLVLQENGLMIAILTAEGRTVPKTDADRVNAFNTVIAYSGRYTIDGDRLSTDVDIAWNEAWVGSAQVRSFRYIDSRIQLFSDWGPSPFDPTKTVRGILVWEREVSAGA